MLKIPKLARVNAIEIVLILLAFEGLSQGSDSIDSTSIDFQKQAFENCEQAYQQAEEDVLNDSIKFIQSRYPGHYQSREEFEATRNLFDSIMINKHNILVIRHPYDGFSPHRTAKCYNRGIIDHMDTTYAMDFTIEVWNEVYTLLGKEPPFPNWKKQLKNN